VIVTIRPPFLDAHILTLDEASLLQPIAALKRYVAAEALLRKPTSGALDDCGAVAPAVPACARAPLAHDGTAAKPSVAMKSRRLMRFPLAQNFAVHVAVPGNFTQARCSAPE
jgi:hypothetical protein